MSNQYLKLRRSSVPGKVPTTESIDFGEIALNTHDGIAYMKVSGSDGIKVVPIGSNSGSFSGSFIGDFIGTFTGSLQGTASWAENYNETDPIFTAVSGTFTTTSSFNSFTSSYYSDSSSFDSRIANNSSSVALLSSSFTSFSSSYNTGSFSGSFVGDLNGTSSWATNALTASFAPAYLPLTGGTINGDVTLNGTASIAFLNVTIQSSSIIYSSGSNIFGDSTQDTQTLIGTVLVSGSQSITGSLIVSQGITGSLLGTSSWAVNAITASYLINAKEFYYTGSAPSGSFITTGSLWIDSDSGYMFAYIDDGSDKVWIQPTVEGEQGPIGLTGPQGPSGSQGPTGSSQPFSFVGNDTWATTSSLQVTGSLTVSGSSTFTNIGPAVFSGSLDVSGSGRFTDGLTVTGSFTVVTGSSREFQVRNTGVDIGSVVTDIHTVTGSLNVSGSATISSALNVTGSLNITGSVTYNGHKIFNFGQFQSNIAQSGSANVSQSVQFGTTDVSVGVVLESGSHMKVENAGYYNIIFSAQCDNEDNSPQSIYIWFKKNGVNIPESTTQLTIPKNQAQVMTVNFLNQANANDYYELAWQSTDDQCYLVSPITPAGVPLIPSMIATVTQIA